MYEFKAIAIRSDDGVIWVSMTGYLPSLGYSADITDKYPGGNIVYIVDPGFAQVFIEITPGGGGQALKPWAGIVQIPDSGYEQVEIRFTIKGQYGYSEYVEIFPLSDSLKSTEDELQLSAEDKKLVDSFRDIILPPIRFVVLEIFNKPGEGCRIVPANSVWPRIYRVAYGPASWLACLIYMLRHCHQPPIDN